VGSQDLQKPGGTVAFGSSTFEELIVKDQKNAILQLERDVERKREEKPKNPGMFLSARTRGGADRQHIKHREAHSNAWKHEKCKEGLVGLRSLSHTNTESG